MRVPTRIVDFAFCDLLPVFALALYFKSGHAFLIGLQRKKLRAHFENTILLRVISKAYDFVTRHIHGGRGGLSAALVFWLPV